MRVGGGGLQGSKQKAVESTVLKGQELISVTPITLSDRLPLRPFGLAGAAGVK